MNITLERLKKLLEPIEGLEGCLDSLALVEDEKTCREIDSGLEKLKGFIEFIIGAAESRNAAWCCGRFGIIDTKQSKICVGCGRTRPECEEIYGGHYSAIIEVALPKHEDERAHRDSAAAVR